MAEEAQKRWELENKIQQFGDEVYDYDTASYQQQLQSRPWKEDVHHFKHVKMSAVPLLKMVMHARSGGSIEVMGLMLGRVEGDTMIVTDSFELPVEGTETRVNASVEANEYMSEYISLKERIGKKENAIGWYHSHPGYGCWLSGIDVGTQMVNQQYQEPWCAVVIDPNRTISSGKVELGAFRTYPEEYKPPDEGPEEYQSIPLSKIEDFGVHCKRYYSLDVEYFKSSMDTKLLDLLWNKYWVSTLSSSILLTNRDYSTGQISDLSDKLEQAESQILQSSKMGGGSYFGASDKKKEGSSGHLSKVTQDSSKIAIEQIHGLLSQVAKRSIFN